MENFIDFFLSSSLSPLVRSEDKLGKFQAHHESSLYIDVRPNCEEFSESGKFFEIFFICTSCLCIFDSIWLINWIQCLRHFSYLWEKRRMHMKIAIRFGMLNDETQFSPEQASIFHHIANWVFHCGRSETFFCCRAHSLLHLTTLQFSMKYMCVHQREKRASKFQKLK